MREGSTWRGRAGAEPLIDTNLRERICGDLTADRASSGESARAATHFNRRERRERRSGAVGGGNRHGGERLEAKGRRLKAKMQADMGVSVPCQPAEGGKPWLTSCLHKIEVSRPFGTHQGPLDAVPNLERLGYCRSIPSGWVTAQSLPRHSFLWSCPICPGR